MVNDATSSKFPAALLSTEDVGVFGNNEVAQLIADVTLNGTTLSLNDVSELAVHQWLALRGPDGFEITQIDSVNAGQAQVTVERGMDGTVGVAHGEGQEVKSPIPAIALNQLRDDLIGVETYLGVDGDCITWDRAIKLSPTHDTCPILELDLSSSTTNTQFIRFSSDGTQTGAILYDSANDAVEFQNVRVDIGSGADLLLEDDRILRLGTNSDAQILYRSADDRIEFISDKDFRFEQSDGTEAVTIDTNAAVTTNLDIDPRTDSARSLGNASARYLEGHFDRLLLATDAAAPSHTEGMLFYDGTDNDKSLSFYVDESEVTLNVGQEQWIRVRNDSGGVISNGEAVYVTGVHGGTGLPTVAKAQADALATSEIIGLATHDIEDASFGYVTTYGKVRGLDTSSFADGAELFLSATTPGALTATRPSLPNFSARVGIVTRSNISVGSILVEVDGPREGAYATGAIPFGGSDGYLDEDSTNLLWDDANNQLQLAATGSGAGILFGGDAQLYHSAANVLELATGDTFAVETVTFRNQGAGGDPVLDSNGANAQLNLVGQFDATLDIIARKGGAAETKIGAVGPSSEAGVLIDGDVVLYRGAADRLDVGTGDDFNLVLGAFQIAGTTVFESDRDVAIDLLPTTDAATTPLDLGSASQRWQDVIAQQHEVYASAGDANPVARLSSSGLQLGAGGGTAPDIILQRVSVNLLETLDSFRITRGGAGQGGLSVQISGDSNPRFSVDSSGVVEFGSGSGAGDVSLSRGDANRLDLASSDHLQLNSGDIRFDDAATGVILKDTQGTPHYWRVQVDNTGALTTTDLGTSLPAT